MHPNPSAVDDALVSAVDMSVALTAAALEFEDGCTQVFTADGRTTFVKGGRSSEGEWSILGDGAFCSFWPADHRALFTVRWRVDATGPIGVSFTDDAGGQRFDARYL
jgi:hypothetical protein